MPNGEPDTMTNTETTLSPERQNAHDVAERMRHFFERIDADRALRRNSPAPSSRQGISPVGN